MTVTAVMRVVMPRQDLRSKLTPVTGTPLEHRQTGKRILSEGELQAILKRHHAWIASGWNVGQRADLQHMDLHQADLDGAALMLVDLHGADLRGARLRAADLESSDLRDANLRMADLGRACLRWADLQSADLRRANLKGVDFRESNLHDTDLRGANLRGADLSDAIGLTQPQLDSAYGDKATVLPADLTVSTEIASVTLSCVLLPLKPK